MFNQEINYFSLRLIQLTSILEFYKHISNVLKDNIYSCFISRFQLENISVYLLQSNGQIFDQKKFEKIELSLMQLISNDGYKIPHLTLVRFFL